VSTAALSCRLGSCRPQTRRSAHDNLSAGSLAEPIPPIPDGVAFAESLVDEALSRFDHLFDDDDLLRRVIRMTLVQELIYTTEGRALAQQARRPRGANRAAQNPSTRAR